MSGLLYLANKLVEARAKTSPSASASSHYYEEFATLAVHHAVDIIKGYQELVRQFVEIWDDEPEISDLIDIYIDTIEEGRASIPEENSGE